MTSSESRFPGRSSRIDVRMPQPDYDTFARLTAAHASVPVFATYVCDELTPVSAFARLAEGRRHAFLLESVIGGEKIARYSLLAADPAVIFEARGRRVRICHTATGHVQEMEADDPLTLLESELNRHSRARLPELPRFVGGAVGYAGYDTVRYYERLPHAPPDDRGLPDLLFGIYESMVVFDHVHKTVRVVAHGNPDLRSSPRGAYDAAVRRIDQIVEELSRPLAMKPVPIDSAAAGQGGDVVAAEYTSNFDRPRFEQAVEQCKEYIRAGDVFQVVLSQRLRVQTRAEPFDIYRALRVVNPSPFMFYLRSPRVILVGSSPEIMCRVEDGVVTSRPLAGTRRRGRTEQEDRRLREELLSDPKERAEHVMLVDLGRNDVGRVAEPGSVRLSEVMNVEYYSHVMHLGSNVAGRLAAGRSAFDALRAALPVGTVSGAPKVRAMEIIDELEPTRRGPYAGAVGYIDFAGNMDTCIALRTLVIQPRTGCAESGVAASPQQFYQADVQVGAGIVADSMAAMEYEETLSKARALLTAVALADRCFGGA
jgi:anthranilate synthase component 1